jgi:hypothetical protein
VYLSKSRVAFNGSLAFLFGGKITGLFKASSKVWIEKKLWGKK